MPSYGKKSLQIRSTIHPVLARLCDAVIKYYDHSLIYGIRIEEEQNDLFSRGLSKLAWPLSKHNADPLAPFPKNLSLAVDVAPYPIPEGWGDLKSRIILARDLEWKERVKFYELMAVFEFEWRRLKETYKGLEKYSLRFGKDWDGDHDYSDQDFDDLVHLEVIIKE